MIEKIDAEKFEKQYAEKSGMTVEVLRKLDLEPTPCDCDSDKCEGWQMSLKPDRPINNERE